MALWHCAQDTKLYFSLPCITFRPIYMEYNIRKNRKTFKDILLKVLEMLYEFNSD